ncbi:MAG: hypothetical protein KDA98_17135, partial [Acidimicrobiales bacterium]|nr:hypothetical protein [Acidimicrobiales bacterium]
MSSESLRDRDRPLLVALVDGRPGVGAGHLGRSLAVVEAWVAGGGRALLADDQPLPDEWRERYAAAGAPIGTGAPDVLLVDGYGFDDRAVGSRRGSAAVVSIDDRERSGRRAIDLAVDVEPPAGGATTRVTSVRPLRCTGPRYALLRREVVAAADPSHRPDATEGPLRLVVAMGGAPTAPVRAALSSAVRELEATTDLAVTWLQGRDDVGAVLAASDLALSAAGSTAWELALHGVPAALVPVADNQVPVAAAVAAAG